MKKLIYFMIFITATCSDNGNEVMLPTQCEVCKVLATELEDRLGETAKTSEVLEIGYSLDDVVPKKKTKYKKSELRLVESLEGICEKILKYNIHKERKDSTRFAKGMSETFKTLHGLVNRGVKVDLGIPYEMWDSPSVEIVNLKNQCERVLEENESDIETWYFKHYEDIPLKEYLCRDRVLSDADSSCLNEQLPHGKDDSNRISDKDEL